MPRITVNSSSTKIRGSVSGSVVSDDTTLLDNQESLQQQSPVNPEEGLRNTGAATSVTPTLQEGLVGSVNNDQDNLRENPSDGNTDNDNTALTEGVSPGEPRDGTDEEDLRPVVVDGDIRKLYTLRGAVTSIILNSDGSYNDEVYDILTTLNSDDILPHISITDLNIDGDYRMVVTNAVKDGDSIKIWYSEQNGITGNSNLYYVTIYPDGSYTRQQHNIDDGFYKVGSDGNLYIWDDNTKQYISTGSPFAIEYARNLLDADDLFFKLPDDEGQDVIIDNPGTTGIVMWGAESANQVALDVNGTSKFLLKPAAIDGITSSISILSGYFINGAARNALLLNGHNDEYFATATDLATKQDIISDLATIRSGAELGATAIQVETDPTVPAWAKAPSKPSYVFSEIGNKPTTISGYGITDAYISGGTIRLGNNTITPVTSLAGYATESYVNSRGFITNTVNDLVNYYTKGQTYTQAEIDALIGSITQFHFEIYPTLPATGQSNVLYLIGPQAGTDIYDEYVYSNNAWTKIGSTSIDLSAYVQKTTQVIAGNGLAGGGALSSDVTLNLSSATIASLALANSAYQLPSSGIPLTDLASGVQASLALADSAYQLPSTGIPLESLHDDVQSSLALADTALQPTDLDGYVNVVSPSGTGNYVLAITKTNKTLNVTYGNVAFADVTGAEDLQAIEALTGTSGLLKKTEANTWTLDTNTYALASDLTAVSGRVTTLENRINWDDYFGIDQTTGAIYVKRIDENTPRDFFSYGGVSAYGIGESGGGGGGIDLERVWLSLSTNTDSFGSTLIHVDHIPAIAISGVTGLQAALDSKQATINDLSTIRNNAGHGEIAYGWGDHSEEGYLKENQTITLSGDITGSGKTSIVTTIGTGKVTNAMLAGSIANNKLANSSITIGSATIYLGETKTLTQIGVPAWAQAQSLAFNSLPSMYIGDASVQDSPQSAQDLGGIKYLTAQRLYLGDGVYLYYDSENEGIRVTGAGLYSDSYITAYGTNSGGGSSIDIDRVWQSLTNNPADPEYANTKIALAHIPNITMSMVAGLSTALDGKQNVYPFTITGTSGAVYNLADLSSIEYARDLLDADDLCFVDPEEGEEIEIDDPGVTGTVLWGSESNSQVQLDVNGTSKWLLKPDAISGIESSVGIILGYFVSGSARNAIKLNGHEDTYFATASSLSDLADTVDGLVTGVSSVAGKSGDVTLAITDIIGLQAALASKLEVAVTSLGTKTGAITLGTGLSIDNNNVLSVVNQTQGTVKGVKRTSDVNPYSPDDNGIVTLPDYPTTLPASDVYAWAKKASLDVADVPNITTSKVSDIETWISGKGYITKTVSDLTNYYQKSETYTQTEVNNIISGLNLGTASHRGVATVISADNANLTPSGLVYSYVNTMLSSVLKWIGETTTDIESNPSANPILIDGDSYTAVAGNVVSLSGTSKEFRFDGTLWKEMGDEASYAYKTISITGTGYLTGGGTLEGNRTIDITANVKSLIDNAVPNTRKVNGHALSADISIDKTDVGLGNVDNLAASGYFTLLANDNNQISVTIGGTNKKLTVAYAGLAGNASLLENHAASYFATASGLSSVSGRVTTVEEWKAIWENIFDIDRNGDVYVKANGNTPRNFYSLGGVSAYGTNSGGGGGGGIDLARVWESLSTNTDTYGSTKVHIDHIPAIAISGVTGLQTALDGKQAVISDLSTIRSNASDGETAYGWGNHATQGYLTSSALTGYANTVQASGTGNYVSAVSKAANSNIITVTYGTLPLVITAARDLDDADDLCFVDPEEGEDVEIDDPGTTGTVLWGGESAIQVQLDVNGDSKWLLKSTALDGINSSIGVLLGYFSSGSARNALALGGHGVDYFATASGLSDLETEVSGLVTGVSSVVGQEGDVTVTQIATALTSAGYKLTDTIYTLPIAGASTLGGVKIGTGLSIDGSGVVSVTGQTQGTVTRVDVGSTQYSPDVNGVVGLPAYPTTLPASDVYDWAKAATKPSYTSSEIGLGNVTNDAQVKRTEMGAASGVATLGSDGKIPSSQLPSYVDDVLEYASLSAFPATGESGKIYVALDTNKTYRWSGTTYTEISPSVVIGTTTGTAFDGGSGYSHVTNDDIHVTASQKTAWTAKYDKPSGGIPKADLAGAVQTSLGNADTAYGWGDHAEEGYLKSVAFADLTSHPDSIAGYGIDDAYIEDHDIHLGNESITVLAADTVYNLVVKNSAGTAVLTYNPANVSGGELALTKAMVGLGNVENTALSTWAGTQNINTLGTITTGVWHGSLIDNEFLALNMAWEYERDSAIYDSNDYIHIN